MNICVECNIQFIPHKLHPNSKRCSSARCKQDYKNAWAKLNPKSKKDWIIKNPSARAKASKKYMQKNKAYYNEYATLRSRNVKQSKPLWLDEFQLFVISEIYDLAQRRNLEVDHIIPIKNSKVCGLHVPWNLQLLTRSQNAKKSNFFSNEDVVCRFTKKD